MKNVSKLLAAVAVSAFLAVSASAFAADGSTPATSTPAPKAAVHHRHHHHHHAAMMCKKDKKGHCMHHHMAAAPAPYRAHETWMGTNPSDYYRHD